MKVEKLMKTDVATCRASATGSDAAKIMWEHDCGIVPIVDESAHVLGMVTDRDLCMASYLQGKPMHEVSLGSTMSRELWTCRPSDEITDAEKTMREHRIRRLPVTDEDGRLTGILSLGDIALEARAETKSKTKKVDVSYTDVAETLGEISVANPRRQPAVQAS